MINMDDLSNEPYAALDQIATRAGEMYCSNCQENLRSHVGLTCLFDSGSTFKAAGHPQHFVYTGLGSLDIYSFAACAAIIDEVNRRDQERWHTTASL